jgi:hypothetical protein
MKIVFAIVMMFAFTVSVSASENFSGEGTTQRPFLISSEADLARLAEIVNNRDLRGDYLAAHYRLTRSLDLDVYPWNAGAGWIPIGNSVLNWFRGTFDGGGHVISNMTMNPVGFSAGMGLGLFGDVRGGTIRNLGLENVSINSQGSDIGGVAGVLYDGGLIENVFVTGVIHTSRQGAGGIAGRLDSAGSIRNVWTTAEVYASGGIAGGIAGTLSRGWYFGNISTVQNSAALNVSVNCGWGSLRITGGTDYTRFNNFAYAGMTGNFRLDPSYPENTGASHQNGETVSAEILGTQTFWRDTMGWDFENIWQWCASLGLPVLQENFNVPPTGGPGGAGMIILMSAFLAVSVVLWKRALKIRP